MNLRFSALALAFVSCGALAQDTSFVSIDQVLTQEDGLTQISEGLYAKIKGTSESYVAVSPAGQRALLAKLLEIRARASTTAGSTTTAKAGSNASGAFDDLIATLSAPQPKNQTVNGTCSGPSPTGPLYAQALAGGGIGGSAYGASGTAVNNDGLSPPLNTTNYVTVQVYDSSGNLLGSQSSTQHGATAAVASTYNNRGCTSNSYATVTCPGYASPSITAVAYNQRTNPQLCIIN